MSFHDHFSASSEQYAAFRPHYPGKLFDFLARTCARRDLAWDCATGNGQAALQLASCFERVVATDASAEQIGCAFPHPRIEYRVAAAEESGLPAGTVDLVTVAQSLHWFDLDAFWREVCRVTTRQGVIAVWCYGLLRLGEELDPLLERFYRETVGPYWPPERRLVDEGYRTLEFPFDEIAAPDFTMEQGMTLQALGGYVRTWSATKRFQERNGYDPVEELVLALRGHWRDAEVPRLARWPLSLRLGRKSFFPGAAVLV